MNKHQNLIKLNISKNSIFISYIFYSILFQIIFSNTLLDINANYLKAFELNDGNNILICTEKGIYLYNKANKIYESKRTFENILEQSEFDFLVIDQFKIGQKYIIVLYKDMIFIFTEDGQFLTEEEVNFYSDGKYYSIVLYEILIDVYNLSEYNFIVCYLKNNDKFMINFFSFNNTSNEIKKINETQLSLLNSPSIYSEMGFSCQLMKSQDYNDVLTCFFKNNAQLVIQSYTSLIIIIQLIFNNNKLINFSI